MFPHLTMVIYNSASSTPEAPRWRVVIPTTCAMTTDVHADIVGQIAKSLNRRGYFSRKQLEKRTAKGLGGRCHGFDTSKYAASSLFYLPAQAAAGPNASFFHTFDAAKRQPINPYHWIDRSIIDKRPAPEPEIIPPAANSNVPASLERKDPKLTRMLVALAAEEQSRQTASNRARVESAIERWRQHVQGTGNEAFFRLAASLAAAGMTFSDVDATLRDEAMFAHGTKSQRDRRNSIHGIVRKLRCAA
jgi:hypothetical protein